LRYYNYLERFRFEFLRVFAILKHDAFEEENEWRIIYDDSSTMASTSIADATFSRHVRLISSRFTNVSFFCGFPVAIAGWTISELVRHGHGNHINIPFIQVSP